MYERKKAIRYERVFPVELQRAFSASDCHLKINACTKKVTLV
jgi:hypothetical protein